MIKDLNHQECEYNKTSTSVCIVGAGVAGIFLAKLLSDHGIKVILLEAGDYEARKPSSINQICSQQGKLYRGADDGRSFGVGGTSVLWGGQMISLAKSDFKDRKSLGFDCWPISYEEINKYFTVVGEVLGLGKEVFLDLDISKLVAKNFRILDKFGKNFNLRLSTWLPFKKRNFSKTFDQVLTKNEHVTLWVNATVICMKPSLTDVKKSIVSLIAQSGNGNKIEVNPDLVVLCAGALESTRILLDYDEVTKGSITRNGSPLGHFFSDHLSATCGYFECRNRRCLNFMLSPIFKNGLMRTPRLELSAITQSIQNSTSAFVHFPFLTDGKTGFDAVRKILRRNQGEQTIPIKFSFKLICRLIEDVFMMSIWRIIYHRLWFPKNAKILLQVDIEQLPNYESRLALTDDLDGFGRKRLVIDWKIQQADIDNIKHMAELTALTWDKMELDDIATLKLTLPTNANAIESLYDVYHPTGSLRMGKEPINSVVNEDLRVWSLDNCYVNTTATFPSPGSANPGLTHLALTARLSEHIIYCLNGKENGNKF